MRRKLSDTGHLPKGAAVHSGLGPPIPVYKNIPYRHADRPVRARKALNGGFPQRSMTLGGVKLIKITKTEGLGFWTWSIFCSHWDPKSQ